MAPQLKLTSPHSFESKIRWRKNTYASVRSLPLGVAILLFLGSVIARIGTSDLPSVLPLILSLTVLLLPDLVYGKSTLPAPLLQMGAILFFFILGWISILLEIDLTVILYLSFAISVYSFYKTGKSIAEERELLKSKWVLTILISIMLMAQVWNQGYLNPLAPESYIMGSDFVHIDTLFLSSITAMIKTYQVVSTGLFGLESLTYHCGSNFLFAPYIQLCKVDVLQFYNIGFPVIFIPLFCRGLLFAAFSNTRTRPSAFRKRIILVTLFLILCEVLGGQIGALYFLPTTLNSHFISQSYCVSLIYTFFAIPIYYDFLFRNEKLHQNETIHILLLLAIPIWFFIIGYTKLSTGVVIFSAFAYVVLRKKLFLNKWVFIASILSFFAICYALVLAAETGENTFVIQLGAFYNVYIKGSLLLYFLLNYWWLILFVVMSFVIRIKARTTTIYHKIISGEFIVLETVVVAALVGILPGLLIHIDGNSALYFSDIQYWMSSVAIISLAPYFGYWLYKKQRWAVKPIKILTFLFLLVITFTGFYSFFRRNFQIRTALVYGNEIKFSQFMKTVEWSTLINTLGIKLKGSGYQKQISNLNLSLFKSLRELPNEVRAHSVIYCEDPTELKSFLPCTTATFYITAMSEMAVINGLQWRGCFPTMQYGMQIYQSMIEPETMQASFQLAKQKGFNNVIVLNLKKGAYRIVKL